jgi:coenzyme F420-reducing hydrogenase alpha subunit
MRDEKAIRVNALARIEGEAGFTVSFADGAAPEVRLKVLEPPRFFEAFLRGRHGFEVPDLTARICGICPVAHMMSSTLAVESALGVETDPGTRALRHLIYLGEWIASHSLHIHMLHAPDFLGYEDVVRLAVDHREEVERGLRLKRLGNEVVRVIGGREIHPVNLRVGGFYRVPEQRLVQGLSERLKTGRDDALETVRWTSGFPFPDFEQDYTFVALSHPDEYAVLGGKLTSNRGLDLPVSGFETVFEEEQVPHSTALHARIRKGGMYLTGPMARFNLNFRHLSTVARQAASEAGMGPVCLNPFRSILIRSIELVHACDQALAILASLETPGEVSPGCTPGAGTGYGCTEAPRGLCWHGYRLDDRGNVLSARIVPPTSQNQKVMESDLRGVAENNRLLPREKLLRLCETAVRNHDPCISCSCH